MVPAGQAGTLPLTGTAPPGLSVADVAPVVLQSSVEQAPAATLAGVAVKLLITGLAAGGGAGGGGAGSGMGIGIGTGIGPGAGKGAGVGTGPGMGIYEGAGADAAGFTGADGATGVETYTVTVRRTLPDELEAVNI